MGVFDFFSSLLGDKKPEGLQSLLSSMGINTDSGDGAVAEAAPAAPKTSMGDMLNNIASGKTMDFNEFLKSAAPKQYEGKSLWNQIMENPVQGLAKIGANIPDENPDGVGFGAMIGRGAEAANKKDRTDFDAEQKRLGEVLTAATKGASDQRTFGLDSKKHTDDMAYKAKTIAETIRDNMEKNKYQNGMLSVAQSNAANTKLGTPIVADDGKTYSFDNKARAWVAVPAPDGVTFNNTKKKPVPSVTFKEGESAWDGLNTALGGNLDAKSKPAIMAIFSEKLQENNNNAPAALQSMVDDFGIKDGKPTKGFKNTGFLAGDNFEYTGNQPSMAAAVGGKGARRVVKQYKSPSTGKTKTVYSDGTEELR